MTVYGNYDVIVFKSCIQIFTVHESNKGVKSYHFLMLYEITYPELHYFLSSALVACYKLSYASQEKKVLDSSGP